MPNKLTTSSIIILLLLILFSHRSLSDDLSKLIQQEPLEEEAFTTLIDIMPKGPVSGAKKGYNTEKLSMEDYHIIEHSPDYSLYAVADGHAGDTTAKYLTKLNGIKENFEDQPVNDWTDDELPEKIKKVFEQTQEKFQQDATDKSGSTLTLVLHRKVKKDYIIANVGDSRAYIITNDHQLYRTEDHCTKNPNELTRMLSLPKKDNGHPKVWIKDKTYFVSDYIEDGLEPSRGFGDECRCQSDFFKPTPDVSIFRQNRVKAMILTTDGAVNSLKIENERQGLRPINQQSDSQSFENDGFVRTCIDRLKQLKDQDSSITDKDTSISDKHINELVNQFYQHGIDDITVLLIPGVSSTTKKALPTNRSTTIKKSRNINTFGALTLTTLFLFCTLFHTPI